MLVKFEQIAWSKPETYIGLWSKLHEILSFLTKKQTNKQTKTKTKQKTKKKTKENKTKTKQNKTKQKN